MNTIRELLSRDLSQEIEEVVKVGQQDETTVYNEIQEYVVTDRLQEQYIDVLEAIADSPAVPTEGVGVWISGFFGSGKSSFAKNLGYVLANREVLGHPASQLFLRRLEEQAPTDPSIQRIRQLVEFINARFPAKVIMFDVQVDKAVRRATEPIAEIMYTVLLRELDYAQDYDVAELEIELEGEGRLGEFIRECAAMYAGDIEPVPVDTLPVTVASEVTEEEYGIWSRVRKGAQRMLRAGAVLHQIDPQTYPSSESWATAMQAKDTDVTIRTLVQRTFDLTARRRPGHAVIFIIDEVGQYVARSAEKIENLRAVVEHFGQEGKNRVTRGAAPAPAWVIVTSQEKLDEVVAAIDDKRVELAKLQDRFPIRIDMAPSDIREVATRRVLAKKPEAEPLLRKLYEKNAALLKTHTRLHSTAKSDDVAAEDFVQFYPYLPHFINLSIDIVSGIRLQGGTSRHIGGSNRTIIKQAYEMLVSDRTRLADAPVGTLVSLDRIYELVEGNIPTERRHDIDEIGRTWGHDSWAARTAKAVALLEYVRDLPRSEENLAALLYPALSADSPLEEVQQAVELLQKHQYIHQTENGWKLQTAHEKSWTTERNAYTPNPREQNEILEDIFGQIFTAPALSRFSYQGRNFRVGVSWENRNLTRGEAQIPVELRVADGPEAFQSVSDAARDDSRAQASNIFWIMTLTTEIDELVTEVYRSQQMVTKYTRQRAEGKITAEAAASLESEKSRQTRYEGRLQGRVEAALAQGRGYFRGVAKEGASLGRSLGEIFKGLFEHAVPDLYPNLKMGAKPLKGNEPEEILKAANLNGLSNIFYDTGEGLGLVAQEDGKYVINTQADIAREVAGYLQREHSYGNKVTGKTLENHFGGLGYGWELEMVQLVLATLLRGGGLEVTYQGRRYRNHLDPQVRMPFTRVNAFRSTSFAPRQAIDLQTLVRAAQRYEALTGDEVDVEESAIAQAFQRLARQELNSLLPLEAAVRAHNIPVTDILQEYRNTLETAVNSASDDAVSMLAGEGASIQNLRDQVATIRRATDAEGLARLNRMRVAVNQLWPSLRDEESGEDLAEAIALLQEHLNEGTFYQATTAINGALERVEKTYQALYRERHKARQQVYQKAADTVKGQEEWTRVPEDVQGIVLKPLTSRFEHELSLPEVGTVCTGCGASLAEMASDVAAVDNVLAGVLLRVQQIVAPEERVERVRVGEVIGVGRTVTNHDEIREVLDQLGDHLHKLVDADVKIVLE